MKGRATDLDGGVDRELHTRISGCDEEHHLGNVHCDFARRTRISLDKIEQSDATLPGHTLPKATRFRQ